MDLRIPITVVCGVLVLAFALAALYSFGSAESWGPILGLGLMFVAGSVAWLGERARWRTMKRPMGTSRAHYLLIALVLVGLVAFFMPPQHRIRIVRFIFVFLAKILARIG
jgi:hypothetical protein